MSSKDDYLNNGGPVFEINPAEVDKNKDGLKPDNTDLKRTTKKTLKDYLSDKSSINTYPIDKNHDENKPDTSVYADPEAKKSPELEINGQNVNQYQFKPQFLQKNTQVINIKPGKLKTPNSITELNGNDLLNDGSDKPDSRIKIYRTNKLSTNRFSDDNQFESSIGNKTFSIRKYMKSKTENDLLKFDQSDNPDANKRSVDLTIDQMNEIADYLMLRASGKNKATPGEASMMIPGIQQLIPGTKMSGTNLEVNEIVKEFFLNGVDEKALGEDFGQFSDSLGVLNNYFDRFGKTSVGTLALSASIIGATMVALLAAALPYALSITNREQDLDYNDKKFDQENHKFIKNNKPSDITPAFEYITGVERSRYSNKSRTYFVSFYGEILNGGQIFFNLNGNALALLGSFGYYINFCRSIVRDTLRIIDLFTPKNGESNFEYADNMISYDTLDIIKNSKLTKCINLFIKLSDIQKSIENNETSFINDNLNDEIKNFKLQSIFNNKLNLINLDINKSSINKIKDLDNFKKLNLGIDNNENFQEEAILNTDYLPFYFKDLRNNKIISFYATISDFSETYSPQWVEESYYGRVDPIKFYKSTTRKVSVSFKVFSHGKDDYEIMWQKLQDLTSLVYPKYTNKRTVETNTQIVEVPFSQSFKSQPLIRIKIGELITNNISSKFNFEILKQTPNGKDKNVEDLQTIEDLFNQDKIKNKVISEINKKRIELFNILKSKLKKDNTDDNNKNEIKSLITKGYVTFDQNVDIKTLDYNKINEKIDSFSIVQLNQINDIDEKNNPFYKAIMNSYGLGSLAYVDSLNYKIQEGYPWEVEENARRPKIIDVSMDLTILHDIQPFSNDNYKHRQDIPFNISDFRKNK